MTDTHAFVVAPALAYARRQPHFDYRFSEPRWHIYVDGVPQCRHAPALDAAAEVCDERPERVCRACQQAMALLEPPRPASMAGDAPTCHRTYLPVVCAHCGSHRTRANGRNYAGTAHGFRCNDCGRVTHVALAHLQRLENA